MKLRFGAVLVMACCLVSCGDVLEFSVNEDKYLADASEECQAGCGEKQICSYGVCMDMDCGDGDVRCSGRQPQVCSGNKWIDRGDACESGALCKNGECTLYKNACPLDGIYRCLANSSGAGLVYHCENKMWSSPSMCPGSASCLGAGNKETAAEVCGTCSDGATKCEIGEGGIAMQSQCVSGKWEVAKTCGSTGCLNDMQCK